MAIIAKIRNIRNIGNICSGDFMSVTATDLNKCPGKYVNQALKEPVVIKRSGQPVVVIVAYERYIELEDAYWGERAIAADQEKSIGTKKTKQFLLDD